MTIAPDRDALAVLPALTDPDRLATIEDTGLLTGADPAMDRLARLAAALLGAPRAFVTLVTPDRQHLAGMVRHDDPADLSRETPLNASLCQFAVATEEPLVIPDSHLDPLVRDLDPVRKGQIGAYAGVPLRTRAGHVLGTLCVVDGDARTWDESRLALLEDLTALAAHEVDQRLTLARERRLHELVEDLTREVPPLADAVHSLVELAEQQEEPRLQRYAALTRSRMEPVLALGRRLESTSSEAGRVAARGRRWVDLGRVLQNCVRSARAATGTDAIRLELPAAVLPVRCDAVGLERSVTHVLVTALHHSRGDAPVAIRIGGPTSRGAHSADDEDEPVATLHVTAEDCPVPTGELARIVARFHEATCTESGTAAPGAPARVRMTGGGVTAESGTVRGEVRRGGRLVLEARWLLEDQPTGVSRR
ncbi:GAF domain-containing protein [Geodermatophilus bullaregiensis]|uniref:GAF domain-containing protein n=1 Tax=Geodermatophilus bullaregiensis TaxID=1564160 RepID=UPI00195E08DA|nr:GAF domain-containing protein [Geodermatophilus bullaregiensis]MBM7807972.1 GAF domain-containing protein [Geodermatophilus bullaregiensis]